MSEHLSAGSKCKLVGTRCHVKKYKLQISGKPENKLSLWPVVGSHASEAARGVQGDGGVLHMALSEWGARESNVSFTAAPVAELPFR